MSRLYGPSCPFSWVATRASPVECASPVERVARFTRIIGRTPRGRRRTGRAVTVACGGAQFALDALEG